MVGENLCPNLRNLLTYSISLKKIPQPIMSTVNLDEQKCIRIFYLGDNACVITKIKPKLLEYQFFLHLFKNICETIAANSRFQRNPAIGANFGGF